MDKIKIFNYFFIWGYKDIDENNFKFCEDKSFKNLIFSLEDYLYY